jgi:hypothetical protein
MIPARGAPLSRLANCHWSARSFNFGWLWYFANAVPLVDRGRRTVPQSYDEFVALIYDAAIEPNFWPMVLVHFSDFVEGGGAKLTLQDLKLSRNEVVSVRMGPDTDRLYAQYYRKINILMPRIKQQQAGAVVLHQQLIEHDVLVRSQYYNEFLKPGDFCSGIGVVMAKERDFWAVASCGRPASAGQFESEQVKRAKLLAPHLSRAATQLSFVAGADQQCVLR